MRKKFSPIITKTKWQSHWVGGVCAWYPTRKSLRKLKNISAFVLSSQHKLQQQKEAVSWNFIMKTKVKVIFISNTKRQHNAKTLSRGLLRLQEGAFWGFVSSLSCGTFIWLKNKWIWSKKFTKKKAQMAWWGRKSQWRNKAGLSLWMATERETFTSHHVTAVKF